MPRPRRDPSDLYLTPPRVVRGVTTPIPRATRRLQRPPREFLADLVLPDGSTVVVLSPSATGARFAFVTSIGTASVDSRIARNQDIGCSDRTRPLSGVHPRLPALRATTMQLRAIAPTLTLRPDGRLLRPACLSAAKATGSWSPFRTGAPTICARTSETVDRRVSDSALLGVRLRRRPRTHEAFADGLVSVLSIRGATLIPSTYAEHVAFRGTRTAILQNDANAI